MGWFAIFKKEPKTVLDALNENPLFKQQKELYDAMSLMCEDGFDADEMPNGMGEFGMQNSLWKYILSRMPSRPRWNQGRL